MGMRCADPLTWRTQNTLIYVICSSGGTLESASERRVRPAANSATDALALTRCRVAMLLCLLSPPQIRAPTIPAPIFGEFGAASRSLLAAHELVVKGGFTNVVHVVRYTRAQLLPLVLLTRRADARPA